MILLVKSINYKIGNCHMKSMAMYIWGNLKKIYVKLCNINLILTNRLL